MKKTFNILKLSIICKNTLINLTRELFNISSTAPKIYQLDKRLSGTSLVKWKITLYLGSYGILIVTGSMSRDWEHLCAWHVQGQWIKEWTRQKGPPHPTKGDGQQTNTSVQCIIIVKVSGLLSSEATKHLCHPANWPLLQLHAHQVTYNFAWFSPCNSVYKETLFFLVKLTEIANYVIVIVLFENNCFGTWFIYRSLWVWLLWVCTCEKAVPLVGRSNFWVCELGDKGHIANEVTKVNTTW